MTFTIPIWALLACQCLITMIIFLVVFILFNFQMEDSITDQVILRLNVRMDSARHSLLAPFMEGYAATESLATMTSADPSLYIPSDNYTLATDVEHFRAAGSLIENNPSVSFMIQLYESKEAPIEPSIGAPYMTYQLTAPVFDSKEYAGLNHYFFKQAWNTNNSLYRQQPLSLQPSAVTSNNSAVFRDRMNDPINRRRWTVYPVSYQSTEQHYVFNATLGHDVLVEEVEDGFSQVAMYSVVLGQMGLGIRYKNSWMVASSVDLTAAKPILLSLTDQEEGETDSYSALYDISSANVSEYKIMAVSNPESVAIFNRTSMQYYQATETNVTELNMWFSDALSLSREMGTEEGTIRTDSGRFLSFAHIRHQNSSLHLFVIVSTAEHRYFSDVRDLRNVTIAISVSFLVLVAGLSLLITYCVGKPIRILKNGMALAATLQNEKVVHTHSVLSEINSLCTAFARMNVLLTEAKAYMPASMMVRFSSSDNDDEHDEIDQETENEMKLFASPQLNNSAGTTTTNQHDKSTRADSQSEETTLNSSAKPLTTADSLASLRNRRVAVLAVNVREFTALPGFSISTIGGHSTSLLDLISVAAASERGVIDSFHGDHFMISFNAVKPVASPGRKAVQCAAAIHNALSGTPYKRLSLGASCGPAVVGSLGNSSQRRLSIVGSCYPKAMRLQKAAAALELSLETLFSSDSPPANVFHCIIDATTKVECAEAFDSVHVGILCEKSASHSTDKHQSSMFHEDSVMPVSFHSDANQSHKKANGSGSTVQRAPSIVANTNGAFSNNGERSISGPFVTRSSSNKRLNTKHKLSAPIFAVVLEVGSQHDLTRSGGGAGSDETEWMYEIHQKALKNPFRWVNEAMVAALGGDLTRISTLADERILTVVDRPQTAQFFSYIITQLKIATSNSEDNQQLSRTTPQSVKNTTEEHQIFITQEDEHPIASNSENLTAFTTNIASHPMTNKEIAELSEWLRITNFIKLSLANFANFVAF